MKLNSPLFDSIRVKPDQDRRARREHPECDWQGCARAGTHRAPKGRMREGEYYQFCIDHVRQYNKSYNYFSGMDDDSIARYQKASMTGHRPTWKMGVNKEDGATDADRGNGWEGQVDDELGLFRGAGFRMEKPEAPKRHVGKLARKHFEALDLEPGAPAETIKTRYKELVKRHHPDANGGDRGTEDKLREVIQAYGYLKSAGFCS